MTSVTTKPDPSQPTGETAVYLFDNWFDPIEAGLRDRAREFIHAMIEGELDMALSRPRYARHAKSPSGEAEETVGPSPICCGLKSISTTSCQNIFVLSARNLASSVRHHGYPSLTIPT